MTTWDDACTMLSTFAVQTLVYQTRTCSLWGSANDDHVCARVWFGFGPSHRSMTLYCKGRRGAWDRQHWFGGAWGSVSVSTTALYWRQWAQQMSKEHPTYPGILLFQHPVFIKKSLLCWELYSPSELIFPSFRYLRARANSIVCQPQLLTCF